MNQAPPFHDPSPKPLAGGAQGAGRWTSIDLLRFWAFAVVIGGHYYQSGLSPVSSYPPVVKHVLVALFQNGAYGVTAFFVVSGFLITRLLVAPLKDLSLLDLKAFYVRRAARIFPLLGLVVGVAAILSAYPLGDDPGRRNCLWSGPGGFGYAFWASLATFTFNWFLLLKKPLWQIGIQWAVLWSLAVEEQFYFFYPLFVKGLGTRRRLGFLLGFVVVSGILFRAIVYFQWPQRLDLSYIASFSAFDQLALGGITYLLSETFRAELSLHPDRARLIAFLGLLLAVVIYGNTQIPNPLQNILAPTLLALGFGLFILGGLHSGLDRVPFWRGLSYPGRLSYGCYLWHNLVLFALWPWVGLAGRWGGPFLFLAAVLLGAEGSFRYFEIPLNRWIRSRFGIPFSNSL